MNKINLKGIAVLVAAGALVVTTFVFADNTPLAVSCSGGVSGNVITWTALATGGTAPYSLSWSGDSNIAGHTSTAVMGTYLTNGTYTAFVQAMDSASGTATTSCQASVTSNVTPAPTSTLDVFVAVNNGAGGSAISSNFTVNVSGASATPSSFAGTGLGTAVTVNASSSYAIGVSTITNYAASESGNCSGPITAGGSASCTITETYVPPSSTPPPPKVNQPSLSIGPNGNFTARGMMVTSVASGSFQAQVWGITYTVTWPTDPAPLEFWFRFGRANATSTPFNQVAVGDEVGVSGKIASSSSFIVNADVVRDYNLTAPRPVKPHSGKENGNGKGNGNGNGNEGNNNANSNAIGNRLNELFKQFQNLQNFWNKH